MGHDLIDFSVDALAVYRLTRLAVEDRILDRPRNALTLRSDTAAYLLSCHWCSSVWLGLGVAAARRFAPRAWDPIARGLAASAVTGIVSQHV